MLLGFKGRFEEPIQQGTKVFTMRKKRKVPPKLGETLHMYTGLRTNKCRKISDKEKLISKQKALVRIYWSPNHKIAHVHVDGRAIQGAELYAFLKCDGFANELDFITYWITSSIGKKPSPKKTYRVCGILDLYHWTDLRY